MESPTKISVPQNRPTYNILGFCFWPPKECQKIINQYRLVNSKNRKKKPCANFQYYWNVSGQISSGSFYFSNWSGTTINGNYFIDKRYGIDLINVQCLINNMGDVLLGLGNFNLCRHLLVEKCVMMWVIFYCTFPHTPNLFISLFY